MNLTGCAAFVTGGASGLGRATAHALHARGARVFCYDRDAAGAERVAAEVGGAGAGGDVLDADAVSAALDAAAALGPLRVAVNCAGIGTAKRVLGRDGPMPLEEFERVVRVNLIGTFNVTRLAVQRLAAQEPLADGERGVIIMTASVAAFEGQLGQAAYAASKGGIAALTLPLAREFAAFGVRVVTIAPGLFATPLLGELPPEVQASLASSIPFPRRLGAPEEYGALAAHICENLSLNGETIRLDGALRLPPR